ncbi:YsnF/AvaK domain-containing protein [Bacillus salipaludis]|uniref:YsnF/AvaK domain-containing protein n=1 Tax=Bacillus salipaludis TaxID=2547811 RepID=UPI003D2023E7
MEKRIVGTFNSESEVLYAIEGLKRQGHSETDMMVVAENRSNIPLITSHTGVMVEADMQMSTVAGVMMDNFVTMMTAGMGGRPARALSSRLIERGLSELTAKQCEEEIKKGKITLLVDTYGTYESPINKTYETQYETEKTRAVPLSEEQLDITKQRVQVGELQLRKEVVEEERTVLVPLMREEVYIERRPVIDGNYDGRPFSGDEIIRIPITEERIEVTKRPVVVEEVIVGKRKIQETKQVQDVIKKEEARIERSVPSSMESWTPVNHLTDVGQEEVSNDSPNNLSVEGNPNNTAFVMSEDQSDETREKRTGSVAIQAEKNKPELSASKKDKTSRALTDSSDMNKNENESSVANSAVSVKLEATHNKENSTKEEKNKNKKNQQK